MSDFCKQCSFDTFGEDFRELAGLTSPEAWADGKAAVTICEGCGPIQVDPDGLCVSADCLKKHADPKQIAFAAAKVGTIVPMPYPVECCGIRWSHNPEHLNEGKSHGWTRDARCGKCNKDLSTHKPS